MADMIFETRRKRKMSNHTDYDASQIQVLEGLEAVKRRRACI